MGKKGIAAAVLAATAVLAGTPAMAAEEAGRPSITGAGGGELTFPGFDGHPVRFEVNATGVPGNSAGRFHVNHKLTDGSPFADFEGSVDCVAIQGDLAIVTGVIERADLPGIPGLDLRGRRVGVSVLDEGRHDRIGWSWAYAGFGQDALPCTGTVPFFPVTTGNYRVRG